MLLPPLSLTEAGEGQSPEPGTAAAVAVGGGCVAGSAWQGGSQRDQFLLVLFSHPLISISFTQPDAGGQESLGMQPINVGLPGLQRKVKQGRVRFPGGGECGDCALTMPDGAGSQLSAAGPSPALIHLSKDMPGMKVPLSSLFAFWWHLFLCEK